MKKLLSMLLALILIFCMIPAASAASDKATQAADALYELGLFKGTGTNADGTPIYDLDKTPTRNQAIIMLVRLLGKEEEALAGTWSIPFTDVTDNMKPYIGYAYTNGLTNGYTATTYCGTNPIKANQYIAFVLRALGYESGKDFEVGTSYTLSNALGITNGEYSGASAFTRGDVAIISNNALVANLKGQNKFLKETLNLKVEDQNNEQKADQNKEDAQSTSPIEGIWVRKAFAGGVSTIGELIFSGNTYTRAAKAGNYGGDYETGTFTLENGVIKFSGKRQSISSGNYSVKDMEYTSSVNFGANEIQLKFGNYTKSDTIACAEEMRARMEEKAAEWDSATANGYYAGTKIKTVTEITGAACTGSYTKINDLHAVSKEYVAGCPRYSYDLDILTARKEVFEPYIRYLDSVGTRVDSNATSMGDKDSLLQIYGTSYTYSVGGKNITVSYNSSSYTYNAWVAVYFF